MGMMKWTVSLYLPSVVYETNPLPVTAGRDMYRSLSNKQDTDCGFTCFVRLRYLVFFLTLWLFLYVGSVLPSSSAVERADRFFSKGENRRERETERDTSDSARKNDCIRSMHEDHCESLLLYMSLIPWRSNSVCFRPGCHGKDYLVL